MTAGIYARYFSDSQREESIEGRFGNARLLLRRAALPFSGIISTVLFPQRQINARNFKTL